MRLPIIILMAVLSGAALSVQAQAHPGGAKGFFGGGGFGGGFPGPRLMMAHMADHLDLDETQRAQVRDIMQAAKPEFQAIRQQVQANRETLTSLDPNDPDYATVLNNVAASNGQLATEGTLLAHRVRSEIQAILTVEQKEKLARSKARMQEALQQRRGEQ